MEKDTIPSEQQHHFLLGALLGNLHCRPGVNGKCRVQISQSLKQKMLVD